MSTAAAQHATPRKRKASSSDEIDFTKHPLQFSFAKGACKCLNKEMTKKEIKPPFYKTLYEKTIGPNSMLQVVWPNAKNVVLFVGVVGAMHFFGDELALPSPI